MAPDVRALLLYSDMLQTQCLGSRTPRGSAVEWPEALLFSFDLNQNYLWLLRLRGSPCNAVPQYSLGCCSPGLSIDIPLQDTLELCFSQHKVAMLCSQTWDYLACAHFRNSKFWQWRNWMPTLGCWTLASGST